VVSFLFVAACCLSAEGQATSTSNAFAPLVLYKDGAKGGDAKHYRYRWLGAPESTKFEDFVRDEPHDGTACVKVRSEVVDRWSGILWQRSIKKDQTTPGGINLTGAKSLTFWARGAKGGEKVDFRLSAYPSGTAFEKSAEMRLRDVQLDSEWKQYRIDLQTSGLKSLKEGVVLGVMSRDVPGTICIDDVQIE
jgi:hypothetical protein